LIRASSRYVPHLLVLLLLAAIPSYLHHTDRLDVDDCAHPEQLLDSALAPPADGADGADGRRLLGFESSFGSGNWAVRPLASEKGEIETVVVRSFDPKVVYHWPEGRILPGVRSQARRHEKLDGREGTSLSVHRVFFPDDPPPNAQATLAGYHLVYESRPVSNPYLAQILSAPLQLVRGRRPMWLFFVYGRVPLAEREEGERVVSEWLKEAWVRYQAACQT
jgi:hypothetical protein